MGENGIIEFDLEQEIEKRVKIIDAPGYDSGPALNRSDAIAAIVIAIVCILGLIWGAM